MFSKEFFEKLILKKSADDNKLTLYLLVSSELIEPCDTLMILLKQFFGTLKYEKNRQTTKMHVKLPSIQKLTTNSGYNVCLFELSQQFFSHVRTFYWVEPVLSNELKETAPWSTMGF